MPKTVPSLWPPDFGEITVLTPVAILRQQGMALGQQTQNIVLGRVTTRPSAVGFRHAFSLYCGPLGYSIELFSVYHGIDVYPAKIREGEEGDEGPAIEAANAEEFSEKLRQVFANPKTKQIISSLLAQSKQ
jgi:hypothetical protein